MNLQLPTLRILILLCAFCATTTQSSASTGDRTFTLTNKCSFDVWVGAIGGATKACDSNGKCPTGQVCNTSAKEKKCFWQLPPLTGGNHLAAGDSTSLSFSAPPSGNQKWSGNLYVQTACDTNGKNCQTGLCPANGCNAFTGPKGPVTLAEFTLQTDASDFYDITVINGVNVSVEMAPASGQTFAPAPSGNGAFYWCGNPGGATPNNPNLKGCTWSYNPVVNGTSYASFLHMVPPGGTPCSADDDCQQGEVCGLAAVSGQAQVKQVCGERIGWWSANEVCVYTNNTFTGAPFFCPKNVPNQGDHFNLYACNGTNSASCYGVNSSTCCGCPNWTYPPTESCKGNNSAWQSTAFPWVKFLKDACPTSYTFPYDDPTSTFQCQTTGSTNTTNYDITFCP